MSKLEETAIEDQLSDRKPHPGRRMTAEEFDKWYENSGATQAEWVDGEVIMMCPDNSEANELESFLVAVFQIFVSERVWGTVFHARQQLRFPNMERRREPDITLVSKARSHIIQKAHLNDAPDLTVEIVSPESERRDWEEKPAEYEAAGIREHWIIDPEKEIVAAFKLKDGKFHPIREIKGKIRSTVLRGFYLKPEWLWQTPRPTPLSIAREWGLL